MSTKRSRVHPTYKTKYRVTNWPEYDRGLVRRGDVTLWISPEAIDAWTPRPSGTRGGQRRYSDTVILTALTLRLVFHLPLRQTEGFVGSLLELMDLDLDVPDHTTLSRRSRSLDIPLKPSTLRGPVHLILDSTGLSIVGEGQWAAAKHGERGRRGWKKLHLGVAADGTIVAQVLTDGNADDPRTGVAMIEGVPGQIVRVTADAAYDTHDVYAAAAVRGAAVFIPPIAPAIVDTSKNPRSPERDTTVRRVGAIGRRAWKRESGYHRQGTTHTVPGAIRRFPHSTSPQAPRDAVPVSCLRSERSVWIQTSACRLVHARGPRCCMRQLRADQASHQPGRTVILRAGSRDDARGKTAR